MTFVQLARKDLLGYLLSPAYLVATAIVTVLSLWSAGSLSLQVAQERDVLASNRQAVRTVLREAPSVDQALEQLTVARPVNPMKALVVGVEKDPDLSAKVNPQAVQAGISGFTTFRSRDSLTKNPVLTFFPNTDMAFIVSVVLGLLVFVLSHDAVSGERERGTLRLVLSCPVARTEFLLAKWVGGVAAMMIPTFLVWATGVTWVWAVGGVERGAMGLPTWSFAGPALALGAAAALYVALMFSVGLFVSTVCRRSSTSITVLLLTWVVFALVIPNAAPYVAGAKVDVELDDEQVQEEVLGYAIDRFKQMMQEMMAMGFGGTPPEELEEWRERRTEEILQDTRNRRDQLLQESLRQRDNQLAWAVNTARLSPVSQFTLAASRLAQTGVHHDRRVTGAVADYEQVLHEYRESKTGGGMMRSFGREREQVDLSDFPEFQEVYRPEAPGDRLAGAMPDLGLLASGVVIFLMLSNLAFLRSDLL